MVYGAQRRLQQPLQLEHSVPSSSPEQFDEPLGGLPHVPSRPLVITHEPLQHSLGLAQASPVSAQNEGCPQIPPAQ